MSSTFDEEEDYVPEYVLEDDPISYKCSEYHEIPDEKFSGGITWDEINSMDTEEFKKWYQGPLAFINGHWIDQTQSVGWIEGPWANKEVQRYIMSKKMQPDPVLSPIEPTSHVAPFKITPTHTRDYTDASSYSNMLSYKNNTVSHVRMAVDILDQVEGQLIAPADGWGLIKSMRDDTISGDLHGEGGVKRETIHETLVRGGEDLPVILAYAYTFLTPEDKRMLEKRRGPVIIMDEWPILLERPDLRSIGQNIVSYGVAVTQRVACQDNAKIRKRLTYDFNLASVNEGYHWHDWGPYLYYLTRFRTDLTHSSSRPFISDALRQLSVLSPVRRRKTAVNYVSTYVNVRDCYFCPIGRVQPFPERALGRTNWLFSRTVYYGEDALYDYIPKEEGHFYCSMESRVPTDVVDFGGLAFLPHKFKIKYDGRVYREKTTGFQLCTNSERSQVDFVLQYMPTYDSATASYLASQRFSRKVTTALRDSCLYKMLNRGPMDTRVENATSEQLDLVERLLHITKDTPKDYATIVASLGEAYRPTYASILKILRSDRRFTAVRTGDRTRWQST